MRAKNPYYGQRQKAYEAIGAAHVLTAAGVPTLFNMVLHQGNLSNALNLIDALQSVFPGVVVNPYPEQTAFFNRPGAFTGDELFEFEELVDKFIEWHMAPRGDAPNIAKRLHYWLALKAACLAMRNTPQRWANTIAGDDFWRCFRQPGAELYLKVGVGSDPRGDGMPGGHLGCTWNKETVTLPKFQVWDMPAHDISSYMLGGNIELSKKAPNPCGGCGFPRLLFNFVSTELGLSPKLLGPYFELRREFVGF